MPIYSRLVGFADIKGVDRVDNNVVLSVRNAVRDRKLRYHGTVTFIDVKKVDSIDERNDLVQRDLDEMGPHWRVVHLDFEGSVAVLGVHQIDMHDVYPVLHRIICQEVKVKMRPDVLRTLANALY